MGVGRDEWFFPALVPVSGDAIDAENAGAIARGGFAIHVAAVGSDLLKAQEEGAPVFFLGFALANGFFGKIKAHEQCGKITQRVGRGCEIAHHRSAQICPNGLKTQWISRALDAGPWV